MAIQVKVYAGTDDAVIVWTLSGKVSGIRGFAIKKKTNGKTEILPNWVGPSGSTWKSGDHKPSTVWPIQRFRWIDHAVTAGDNVQYQVIVMTGTLSPNNLKESEASAWSAEAEIGGKASKHIGAYFNRGIVAAQWVSRRLDAEHQGLTAMSRKLNEVVEKVGDPFRNMLAGPLREEMLLLLSDAKDKKLKVYAALFELNDPELTAALLALGKNASVLLGNGSAKKKGEDPNKKARAKLKGKVNLSNRMSAPRALAHNKILIVCDKQGKPATVLTGSTNWSITGLCTQANNALVIHDSKVAARYKQYWDKLKAAKDATPETLVDFNSQLNKYTIDGSKVTVWFTKTRDQADLDFANELINKATQGILFLMFNPGPRGSLLNTIIERNSPSSPSYNPNLYVHGAINQDPSTSKNPIVGLFHRGEYVKSSFEVVLPATVNPQLKQWEKELKKKQGAFAMIHSKVVVLDPFGHNPVVITGSHNLGPKASGTNDENLVIIQNHPLLAANYALNIIGAYDQYRWRYRTLNPQSPTPAAQPEWDGLEDNDSWIDGYLRPGPKADEIKFWIGI